MLRYDRADKASWNIARPALRGLSQLFVIIKYLESSYVLVGHVYDSALRDGEQGRGEVSQEVCQESDARRLVDCILGSYALDS